MRALLEAGSKQDGKIKNYFSETESTELDQGEKRFTEEPVDTSLKQQYISMLDTQKTKEK